MSKIDSLIKDLLIKKKKIDYISYIADLLKGDKKCVDYLDVKDEVLSQIEPILLKLMNAIENDLPVSLDDSKKEDFSNEEKDILKMVVSKAKEKTLTPQPKEPIRKEESPKKPLVSNQDKLSFGLNNRHLANSKVQVINDQNINITGLVVGIDAPFIIVKTDQGPTISVPLDKVVQV